ncbi:hypothetical protein GCM10023328_47670 [Modestobacter marinus]|uniref:Uncharacterized protein n=1 Tax=Modestobacter marinus TaxID=477641 RepID=A0ABQ2GBY8_9ACTN|nr:hypothetical protein GCM10011589_47600 [Modestobacter marinus]
MRSPRTASHRSVGLSSSGDAGAPLVVAVVVADVVALLVARSVEVLVALVVDSLVKVIG